MKIFFFALSIFCALGFTTFTPFQDHQEVDFEWLLGTWQRTNEKVGLQTYEHWKKLKPNHYKALGFTMKKSDTVWQESIELTNDKGTWRYKVKLKGVSKETVFKVTLIEKQSFTCENKQNEFPKKIRYEKGEKGLNAVISGDRQEVLFQFIKVQ